MGIKTDDYHTVPLCPEHHGEFHQRGQVGSLTPSETQAEMWRAVASMTRARLLASEGAVVRLQRRWAMAALSLFEQEPLDVRESLLDGVVGLLPPEVGKIVKAYASHPIGTCSYCGERSPLVSDRVGSGFRCAWECAT